MFEAWLLIENTPKEVFSLENFKQTFPGWEERIDALYGTARGSSFVVEEQDSSSDEEDVPLQAQRRRERLQTNGKRKRGNLQLSSQHDNDNEL